MTTAPSPSGRDSRATTARMAPSESLVVLAGICPPRRGGTASAGPRKLRVVRSTLLHPLDADTGLVDSVDRFDPVDNVVAPGCRLQLAGVLAGLLLLPAFAQLV